MKKFLIASLICFILLVVFFVGLFNASAFLFGSSFLCWTPAVAFWGFALSGAGIRLRNPVQLDRASSGKAEQSSAKQATYKQQIGKEYR